MTNLTLDYISGNFTNKKLKKIVNVYQKQYINGGVRGFGDFLRGSFYLTIICDILGLEFDIDLTNHPMSKFLKISNSSYDFCKSSVESFIDNGDCSVEEEIRKNLIKKLDNFDGEIYYLFCNFQMLFHIENLTFNRIQCAKNILIPKIELKEDLLNILDRKLESCKLLNCKLQRNNYAVIHIRCGDCFMNVGQRNEMSIERVNGIINAIISTINKQCNNKKKYILIGDSNKIKKYITSKFPNIVMFKTQIAHLGEDKKDNNMAILDTLIDFNIMRFSNYIISFTVYTHGSGFSKYCSQIYDIPFKQIQL